MTKSQISSSYYSCHLLHRKISFNYQKYFILQPYPLTDFLGMATKGPVTSSAHIRQAAELMRFYLHSTSSLLSYNPSLFLLSCLILYKSTMTKSMYESSVNAGKRAFKCSNNSHIVLYNYITKSYLI